MPRTVNNNGIGSPVVETTAPALGVMMGRAWAPVSLGVVESWAGFPDVLSYDEEEEEDDADFAGDEEELEGDEDEYFDDEEEFEEEEEFDDDDDDEEL